MDVLSSSPIDVHRTRKSQFTYRHLQQMKSEKVDCPLRVIAHIDLDAFYAQCEMVRLKVDEKQPLAVQQWANLIAINYPAREFEINRHIAAADAKKKCPNIKLVHVATWRVGQNSSTWQYPSEGQYNIATDKVSLDPYRRESKKILAVFRESCSRLEKASVDEAFMDLSHMVYERLLERYKEELNVVDGAPIAPYEDTTECLRLPEIASIEWGKSHLIDLEDGDSAEEDALDWDDVAMGIGAEIVMEIRRRVREELGYTCSAGIARNKMLAKLAGGYKKPAQQSVVRNRAVSHFLSSMKFTKIRMLGGKLGSTISDAFATESLADLLPIPLETMKNKFDDDTGTWLFHVIRGIDKSEVNVRTEIKSMLSAKSFRPHITKRSQGEEWLRIFVADIASRINEETIDTEDPNSSQPISIRRPKQMTLHHRYNSITKSRQASIPLGKPIDEDFLFSIAVNLLKQIEAEGNCWPCINLSLSVGGFDDVGRGSNRGIGTWLVRGDEAKVVNQENLKRSYGTTAKDEVGGDKRRKTGKIETFFGGGSSGNTHDNEYEEGTFGVNEFDEDIEVYDEAVPPKENDAIHEHPPPVLTRQDSSSNSSRSRFFAGDARSQTSKSVERASTPDGYFTCHRCNKPVPLEKTEEHTDWHFARDLYESEKQSAQQPSVSSSSLHPPHPPLSSTNHTPTSKNKKENKQPAAKEKKPEKGHKLERGQKLLFFK